MMPEGSQEMWIGMREEIDDSSSVEEEWVI
jgi:hypothetical protein